MLRLCVESTVLLMHVKAETHRLSVNTTHMANRRTHKACNRHLISSLSDTHTREALQCVFDVSECDYFTARLEKWNELED